MENSGPKDRGAVDPDNIIAIALDELSEDERRELQQELEEDMKELQKKKLAGYQRTRNGVIKRVIPPSSSAPQTTEVSKPISADEIAYLIDTSVASKFGDNMMHFMDQFSKNLENSLPGQIRSVVLQINDEQRGKQLVAQNSSVNLPSISYAPAHSASPNVSLPQICD